MKITLVEWAYDADLADEQALLRRYATTTGWCEALQAIADRPRDGVSDRRVREVSAVIRFHRDARVERRGVVYHFCRDDGGPRPSAWTAPARLATAIAAIQPDLVHVNGLGFPMPTWRLRQRLPATTALVVQDHANALPTVSDAPMGQMKQLLRRRAMRAVDGFLFTAVDQAAPWRRDGLIDAGQSVHSVIEGSTTMTPVGMTEARRLIGVSGSPVILWVGRLDANKDPLCVLEAFARIRVTRAQATLVMLYGRDDLLPEVQRRIERDPRLRGGVRLVGAVPHEQMARYYSAADLFVLGSHHEGSGYALLEACACGVPPAVTDIPAFRRLTRDGAVGRLWTPGDPHACAVAMNALLRVVGPIARANVRGYFQRALSWAAVARDAQDAYADVIGRRRLRLRAEGA